MRRRCSREVHRRRRRRNVGRRLVLVRLVRLAARVALREISSAAGRMPVVESHRALSKPQVQQHNAGHYAPGMKHYFPSGKVAPDPAPALVVNIKQRIDQVAQLRLAVPRCQ